MFGHQQVNLAGELRRRIASGSRPVYSDEERGPGLEPRVIFNKSEDVVHARVDDFVPLLDRERFDAVQKKLALRGKSQRGIRRSRDPMKAPLGMRVIDLNCGHPMYSRKRGETSELFCGLYSRTHGEECEQNVVASTNLRNLVLRKVQEQLEPDSVLQRLRSAIATEVARQTNANRYDDRRRQIECALSNLTQDREKIVPNLARASAETYKIIERELLEVDSKIRNAKAELEEIRSTEAVHVNSADLEVSALRLCEDLKNLYGAKDDEDFLALVDLLDVRVGIHFEKVSWGKRLINRASSGILKLGSHAEVIDLSPSGIHTRQGVLGAVIPYWLPITEKKSALEWSSNADCLRKAYRGDRI